MSFLQQLIQYLSQPPDSIVYHVITLLAIQATLGLAWWQARRRPDDAFARRLAWASGAMLLSRLLVVLALFATADVVESVVLLPPLERAIDTLTAALLVWALAPQPKGLPHLGSALLLIVTIVIGFFYVSFALEWRELLVTDAISGGYSGSDQAAVWDIMQMIILGVGGALILAARESQWSLRLAILAVLFVAHALSWWFGDTLGQQNAEISFWVRLGNVVAFPMLAVLTYRHNLHRLLPVSHFGGSDVEHLVHALNLSRDVSSSQQTLKTVEAALDMVFELLPANFVGVALVSDENEQQLHMFASVVEESGAALEPSEMRTWALKRGDWPSFSLALAQRQQVELLPDGPGARQLHELARELNVDGFGASLVEPLATNLAEIGLLLVSSNEQSDAWSESDKSLCSALASFVAQMLDNARRYQMASAGRSPDFEQERATLIADLQTAANERDQALQEAGDLREQLAFVRNRLEVEHRKSRQTSQALALTAQRQAKLQKLEEEVDALREALSEAEVALASAAAASAGISTEWVMRTVSRYSGELEEAQAQIHSLELKLQEQDDGQMLQDAADRAIELRTPLTSLGGYTDLLLEGRIGSLSPHQESLLLRMRVNVEGMTRSIERISAAANQRRFRQMGQGRLDVRETIEAAISVLGPDLQARALRVDLNVDDDLPPLYESTDEFYRVFIQALKSACLASNTNSRLVVGAGRLKGKNGASSRTLSGDFLRLSISDKGGERSHSLYVQALGGRSSDHPKALSTEVAALSSTLDSTSQMAAERGGRSWLDLTSADGSTLFVLLPLPEEGYAARE